LIEWALDGPYIVIAANQWSVQESDVLQCLQWILAQNKESGSEYEGLINKEAIGLSGHSQGGGAVIKAGDGGGDAIAITATIPMNPYGPAWVNPENQDGPMLLLGGCLDTTTPLDSYAAVWEAVKENDHGGINAALVDGTHNDDPWGPDGEDAADYNFGRYQIVTELWWDLHLNGNERSGRTLMKILNKYPWNQDCFPTQYAVPY
jgi:dienelactone hydrolase